jgi:hypothetical protein
MCSVETEGTSNITIKATQRGLKSIQERRQLKVSRNRQGKVRRVKSRSGKRRIRSQRTRKDIYIELMYIMI